MNTHDNHSSHSRTVLLLYFQPTQRQWNLRRESTGEVLGRFDTLPQAKLAAFKLPGIITMATRGGIRRVERTRRCKCCGQLMPLPVET